jgi:hypothetical protein
MNTKVVPNIVNYLLIKFQTYPTCIAQVIVKISPLHFLKNWNSREVETEFFDHLNSWIRLRVEYQSCRTWNYLAYDEISDRFDESNRSYEFFRNGWHCKKLFSQHVLSSIGFHTCSLYLGGYMNHIADAWTFIFQMVGSTRGTPGGFQASSSGAPPPLPPPPGLAEVLAAQTELLRQIVQGQQQQWGRRNDNQPQSATYPDFFGTHPPLFNRTEEPLDADTWINTIESKFDLLIVPCSEANKARFTA